MSAVTSIVSPTVRLMGKRPQSISGRTFSITTFLAKLGLAAPSPFVVSAAVIAGADLADLVFESCVWIDIRQTSKPELFIQATGEPPDFWRRRKLLNN